MVEFQKIRLVASGRVFKTDRFTAKGWLYANESGIRGWHVVCTSLGESHSFWFQQSTFTRPVLHGSMVSLYECAEPGEEEKAAILGAIAHWESEQPALRPTGTA